MTSYSVYLKPDTASPTPDDEFRLVPDTKATFALLFPPFWLAWHRLWLALLGYIVVMVAILLIAISSPGVAVSYLSVLPGLYLLLEGYELVRNKLENTGWKYAGIVDAENREEAEIRFILERQQLSERQHSANPKNNPVFSSAYQGQKTKQQFVRQPTATTTSLFPE